ncbi:hypothetical protein [Sinorhizobium fredii]|uniref:hypothetical protein n=1 Tax=Rhizobium fredii TaxID=380 RepID=UPI0012FD07B4|nr:hypothetical protein [Sinorhizobium fredii]
MNDIAPVHLCKVDTQEDGTRWAAAEHTTIASSKHGTTASPEQERVARHEAIRRRTGCSMRVLMRLFDAEYRVSIVGIN